MSTQRTRDEQALHDYRESLRRWLGSARSASRPDGDAELWDQLDAAVEELAVIEEELRVSNEELSETREQLERERQRYVELFERAPDGYIVTDRAGVIRQANEAAGNLLNVEPRYLQGKPLLLYLAAPDRRRMWRELEPLMARGAEPRGPLRWQVQLAPRGGGRRTAEVTVASAQNELRWLVRDISDRISAELVRQQLRVETAKRASLEAAERDARFLAEAAQSLTESDVASLEQRVVDITANMLTDFAVLLRDDHGFTVCAASAGVRGKLPREVGKWTDSSAVARVFHTRSAEVLVASAVASELPSAFAEWARAQQVNSVLVLPVAVADRNYGVLIAGNIEPRASCGPRLLIARAFAERAAVAFQMAELLREAQRANEAKSAFLAIVSHELRTPLTSVIGYAELLGLQTAGPLNEQQRKFLSSLEASARHLRQLVDQVLQYARVDAQHEEPAPQPVALGALLNETIGLVEPVALQRGLSLQAAFAADDVMIETNADKLRQIMINLLANAVKFTDQGFVRVRVAEAGDDVLIEVSDSGIGFDEADAAHIFEPFHQLDQADTRRAGGVGLGLAVAHRLVEELGGVIHVDSKRGAGSTFTVRLPRSHRGAAATQHKPLFW